MGVRKTTETCDVKTLTISSHQTYMTYELSMQPLSCFVKESANSHYLKINRSDLNFNPKADVEDFVPSFKRAYETNTPETNPEWEEARRQRQEYWAAVKYARSQLYNYCGAACHFFPGAHGDLIRSKGMSPDEILYEASKNGLI